MMKAGVHPGSEFQLLAGSGYLGQRGPRWMQRGSPGAAEKRAVDPGTGHDFWGDVVRGPKDHIK